MSQSPEEEIDEFVNAIADKFEQHIRKTVETIEAFHDSNCDSLFKAKCRYDFVTTCLIAVGKELTSRSKVKTVEHTIPFIPFQGLN